MLERKRPRWGYPFFGLTDNYKIQLHELIFDLSYYGKLEYFAVYEMPVHYRTLYIRKLANMKERDKANYDREMGKQDAPSYKVVKGPGVQRG